MVMKGVMVTVSRVISHNWLNRSIIGFGNKNMLILDAYDGSLMANRLRMVHEWSVHECILRDTFHTNDLPMVIIEEHNPAMSSWDQPNGREPAWRNHPPGDMDTTSRPIRPRRGLGTLQCECWIDLKTWYDPKSSMLGSHAWL